MQTIGLYYRLLLKAFLLLLSLFLFSSCAEELPVYPIDTGFVLTDHNRQPFDVRTLHSKVIFLYFGFTRCPNICPNTLARLQKAYQLLSFRKHYLQTLMITVDPEHDTPEILKSYLSAYTMGAIGLWGRLDEVHNVARKFGASLSAVRSQGHFIDHSTHIFLLDEQTKVRYFFTQEDSPQKIAGTVRRL